MPSVAVRDVELYYEEYGEGSPVLGIHGTPSTSLFWVDAARRLGELVRCIVYDRRGFHRSVPPLPLTRLDLADHVNDAAALLEALDAVPAVVVGRSTGGQIALELALQRPDIVRALVLLEPAVFTVEPDAAVWAQELRTKITRTVEVDPEVAGEAVIRFALGDEEWSGLPDDIQELFRAAGPAVVAEMRGSGLDLSAHPSAWTPAELARVDVPTLLVTGADSVEACRLVDARLAELLPRAEAVEVPGGHLIDPAHPLVLDFLRRVLP